MPRPDGPETRPHKQIPAGALNKLAEFMVGSKHTRNSF